MNIAKVRVNNYKGVRFTEFVPVKGVNCIIGRNGTGKTTVLDAVIKLLSVTPLSVEDILPGEKKCEISLLLDGEELRITRTSSACSFYINGKKNPQKAVREWMQAKTGVSPDAFASLGGQKVFEGMSTKDMTKLLYAVLPMKQKKADVVSIVEGVLGTLSNTERTILDTLPDDVDEPAVKAAYKAFYEARREKGRDVRVYAESAPREAKPSEAKADVEKALSDAEEGIAKARAAGYMRTAYENALKARNAAEQRKAALEEQLRGMPRGEDVSEEDVARWKKERQQFVDAVAKYEGLLKGAETNVQSLRHTLSSIQSNRCPLSESIHCSTDKGNLIRGLEANIAQFDARIGEYKEFIPKCRQQVCLRDERLAHADAERRKNADVDAVKKEMANIVIPDLPEKPAEAGDVSALTARRNEASAKLALFRQYELYDGTAQKAAQAQAQYDAYDRLLPVFADDGHLRTEILSRAVTTYEKACNERADKIRKGFSVRFRTDGGVRMQVAPHGGTYIDIDKLSTGEFAIAAYLIMAVISLSTGAGIVFMDSMDAMDGTSFGEFLDVVTADNAVGQAFIACASHEDAARELSVRSINVIEMR